MVVSGKGWAAFRLKGERYVQEDVHRVLTPWGPDGGTLVFVADGHGKDGKKAAQLVRKKLPGYLRRAGFAAGTEKAAVCAACLKLDREIKLCYNGGTTLTLVYLSARYSFMAWVGDSPGMLVTPSGFFRVTHLHDFARADEIERLRAAGARFRTQGNVPVRLLHPDGMSGAINMTRSLGDPAYDRGMTNAVGKNEMLIPVPEFVDNQHWFSLAHWVLLSSDGMPRALDEACVRASEFEFLSKEPELPAIDAATRFRRVIADANPSDNVVSAFVRPRTELIAHS